MLRRGGAPTTEDSHRLYLRRHHASPRHSERLQQTNSLRTADGLELIVQTSAQDMPARFGAEINRDTVERRSERLLVEAVIKIFGFHRPVPTNLPFDAAAYGISPIEVVTAGIEEVRINMEPGRIVYSNCAAGCVNQPAAMAI